MGIFLIVVKCLLALLVICMAIKLFFRALKGGVYLSYKVVGKSEIASAVLGLLIMGLIIALVIVIGNSIF